MKALILAPFQAEFLKKLRRKIEVTYQSWLDTRRLLSPEELIERIQKENISIIVIEADFIFEEVFEAADKLRFVGICRGSTNNVDIEAATKHGVVVVNTPGRNAVAVAELTLGLMLSLARRIPALHSMVKSGEWVNPVEPYLSLRGIELAGKIAGIIGLGAIGSEVARRLQALEMKLLGYDPYLGSEKMSRVGVSPVSLEELLKESDFITIHCPLSPQTVGLIDQSKIALMKSSAYLINTAGWEIVDEEALLEALKQRRIAGAAFDVYQTHPIPQQSPFLKLDNVILTPHIGGATDGTIERYSKIMTQEIERFLEGKRPQNLVNPEVWKENVR